MVLLISLKLSAPVAFAAIDEAFLLIATLTEIPNPSERIAAVLTASTTTAPKAWTSVFSISASVVFSISLMVSDRPRPTAAAVSWVDAMARLAAPATDSISAASSVDTRMFPLSLVRDAPFFALARLSLRILLTPMEPEMLAARPDPPFFVLATVPAAPMPTARISASTSALIVRSSVARASEASSSAQTRLGSPSAPMLLIANAPPTAPEPAELPSDDEKATAAAPAPARMLELSAA